MNEYRYSYIICGISSIAVFVELVNLYLSNSILWIFVGIALILVLLCLLFSDDTIKQISITIGLTRGLQIIIYSLFYILYFFSSLAGLFKIVNLLPIDNLTNLYLPLFILSLLFLGTFVGIYQKLITSIRK